MQDDAVQANERQLKALTLRKTGAGYQAIAGVYKITNKANGHIYIGSSVNLKKRLRAHKADLAANRHKNQHIQRAWIKYGPTAFDFAIIEECEKHEVIIREQHYIDLFKPEYNMCPIAASPAGRKTSEATKEKLRIANVGKKMSPDAIERTRRAHIGKVVSGETRKKFSLVHSGRRHTDEAKKKISVFNKGKKLSQETIEKIKQAKMGHVVTPETREKLRLANLGKKRLVKVVANG